jgi:hypothetical protein
MEEEHLIASKANLNRILNKIKKYPVVREDYEVELALKGCCIYHCVRQTNIMQVLKDGEIKIKNEINRAEFTNNQNDYFQGFDNHLSMSIGKPWHEYGPYQFVFGIDKISPTALVFFGDPWQWGNKHLEKRFITKEDYITLFKELLKRNLKYYSERYIHKAKRNVDLHYLAAYNFRKFEIKQDKNLKLHDADEFVVLTSFDNFLMQIIRIFWRAMWLMIFIGLFLVMLITNGYKVIF